MSNRALYLVCYDIRNSSRLRQVHHFLQGFKVGGQKSFFECWLTLNELKTVRNSLIQMINSEDDRVHIFQLDQRMTNECYGIARSKPLDSPFLVM